MIEREIRKLQLDNGSIPFDDWHQSLVDKRTRSAVDIFGCRVFGWGILGTAGPLVGGYGN